MPLEKEFAIQIKKTMWQTCAAHNEWREEKAVWYFAKV